MAQDFLEIEIHERIATVVMNRPPVNALDITLMRALIQAFDQLGHNDDVRVVILTGAGKVFCAGADLKMREQFVGDPTSYAAYYRETQSCFAAIRDFSKPVIGAINGAAVGGGLALIAGCDILLASSNALLAMPEITVGVAAGAAQLHRLFSRSKGRRLAFTGGRVDAQELFRTGVVECCVPPESLMNEAMAIARQIAVNSPTVLRAAKLIYDAVETMPYAEATRFQIAVQAGIADSDDVREARQATQEKRPPNYKGR